MATKPVYTYEVATNAPKGQWKVADRVFYDRRLTLKEKAAALVTGSESGNTDLGFLASALSALKVEGEDVTPEWIEDHLSEQDLFTAVRFILGGAEAVEKVLSGNA